MHHTAATTCLLGIVLIAGCPNTGGPSNSGALGALATAGAGNCPSNTYTGEINGVQATARVTVEPLPSYTYVEGEVTSGQFYYTFTADLPGDRGWGDMVDHSDGSIFRIQIDVVGDGFYLTTNPFLAPTTYIFSCQ